MICNDNVNEKCKIIYFNQKKEPIGSFFIYSSNNFTHSSPNISAASGPFAVTIFP